MEPLPSHPAWWGAITAFGSAPDRPALVFAVSHEGMVAVLSLTGGSWVPAAEFLGATRAAPGS